MIKKKSIASFSSESFFSNGKVEKRKIIKGTKKNNKKWKIIQKFYEKKKKSKEKKSKRKSKIMSLF